MELQTFVDLAQLATLVVVVATLLAQRKQVLLLGEQVAQAANASLGQATFALVQFLQSKEVRDARYELGRLQLCDEDMSQWTDSEKETVATVCSSYNVAGMMVRAGLVDRDAILCNWGPSIRTSYPQAYPLVQARRRWFNSRIYWDDYVWLVEEARKIDDSLTADDEGLPDRFFPLD